MKAGKLDTRITILQQISTRDPEFNERVNSWIPFRTCWAQVTDMLPSRADRVEDGINLANRPARIRMRWAEGITTAMRVQIGTRLLRIISGPAMLGRREGLELVAEELTTQGEEP